jgi:nucleoside 2-deoxyribosyltransferase
MTMARADEFFTNEHIMFEVYSGIVRAKVLIADCTGKNPNVFYEIGLAHALGKAVVLIMQNFEDVPFDLRDRRCLQYDLTPHGKKTFKKRLAETLRTVLEDAEKPAHELFKF